MNNLTRIQTITAAHYKLTVEQLISQSRFNNIAYARQVAMSLAREAGEKLQVIGDAFGGRDHGTVIHAIKAVAHRREVEPRAWRDYEAIRIKVHEEAGLRKVLMNL